MNPAALKLHDFISEISEDVYAASWMADCEWGLWAAYQSWKQGGPAQWSFAGISAYMPELEQLHRDAGGWVWWLDYPGDLGGPQFVPDARWWDLVAEREREDGRITNEQLDIRSRSWAGA